MDNAAMKSLHLLMLDGKPEKFQVRWTRFRTYTCVFRFIKGLAKGGQSEMLSSENETLEDTDNDDKKKIPALKRNAIAVANLTMAIKTDAIMALVYESLNNDDWPGGVLH
jgi:hypothetical protein